MTVNEILADLLGANPTEGLAKLQAAAPDESTAALRSAMRLAMQRVGLGSLYYQKLSNLWQNWGRPSLKPNPVKRRLILLTDFTPNSLRPLIDVFCGTWGVDVDVQIPAFNSVEQLAFSAEQMEIDSNTIVAVILTSDWLGKHFGGMGLVDRSMVTGAQDMYGSILNALVACEPAHILMARFPRRTYPLPSGVARHGDKIGWNLARDQVNAFLAEQVTHNVHLVDLCEVLFLTGGNSTLGQANYFRARMAYEPAGTVAVARELASVVASICGKSHRAVVTDWDNTIWGGIVAETGSHGVVCGVEDPDGLAYYRVQEFLKGLKDMGVLLAGVSRNDPAVQSIFQDNPRLCLKLDDFASMRVGFNPKSESIAEISTDLGFGTEFMVFMDDSLFELVEAMRMHPYLDVLRAGTGAEQTLTSLSQLRFWNNVSLSAADLTRSDAALSLKRQRHSQSKFATIDEFLQSIDISLEVSSLDDSNKARVIQMFHKSNQFNLTTRRHGESELRNLLDRDGQLGVFTYNDTFGSQGIISVVMLQSAGDELRIESWLMSCRVLNRMVEDAVFCWIVQQAAGRPIVGEYIPTEKNELVRGLYERLGFTLVAGDDERTSQFWRYDPAAAGPLPKHYVTLKSEQSKQ